MIKLRATLVTMLVLAVGLFVYSPMAFAGHGQVPGGANQWHSDVMTINETGSLGLRGVDFVPFWVHTDCDTPILNGLSQSDPSDLTATGCHAFAEEALGAWLDGDWFDPRGGTEFIPPSGDHHRAGWRLMLQAHFSAGQWLTGFAPFFGEFPFYPNLDAGKGAGEAPVAVYEWCLQEAGLATTLGIDDVTTNTGITDCQDDGRAAGMLLLEFVDHHGEPLTPGRFPRYIPHERQAWVSTLVTKYTASPSTNVDSTPDPNNPGAAVSDITGARISQVFRTQHNFVSAENQIITGGDTAVWFSMSDQSAGPCNDGTDNAGPPAAGGWCKWIWDPTTDTLCKVENTSPGNDSVPGVGTLGAACAGVPGATEVTSLQFINDHPEADLGAIEIIGQSTVGDGTCDPGDICERGMNDIEKAPSEIYQVIGQWVELGGASTGVPWAGAANQNQALWSEFWGLSGPNFQSEEGANPNTWMKCGSNPGDIACSSSGGPFDADFDLDGDTVIDYSNVSLAITNYGLDVVNRWGEDMRPDNAQDLGALSSSCGGTGKAVAGGLTAAQCDAGLGSATVICVVGGNTDLDDRTSDCFSDPGIDDVYGTGDDGDRFYAEVVEEGLRGFLRLNRTYAFSFNNGAGGGHDGNLSGTQRQIMAQNLSNGMTLSCLNCEGDPDHFVRDHRVPMYHFSFDVSGVNFVEHDTITPGSGVIP